MFLTNTIYVHIRPKKRISEHDSCRQIAFAESRARAARTCLFVRSIAGICHSIYSEVHSKHVFFDLDSNCATVQRSLSRSSYFGICRASHGGTNGLSIVHDFQTSIRYPCCAQKGQQFVFRLWVTSLGHHAGGYNIWRNPNSSTPRSGTGLGSGSRRFASVHGF